MTYSLISNNKQLLEKIIRIERNEITEYFVYSNLAKLSKKINEKEILNKIAADEKRHSEIWHKYTNAPVSANHLLVFCYTFLAKILGLTFAIKLMENGEQSAQSNYEVIGKTIPEALHIQKEENDHELQLIGFLDEESLKYVGAMILGVNDALVELTGAIAGLTFTLSRTHLIAFTGLITGIAASISMAGSEYLAIRSEKQDKNPIVAAIYTGVMYLVTVILLILPYFSTTNVFLALFIMFIIAVGIIAFFTFYISIIQDKSFKRRFLEMFSISLGVSVITFFIGYLIKNIFGINL
jgi:vacuolar iron transporter family protein